jgi:hypothetical protein
MNHTILIFLPGGALSYLHSQITTHQHTQYYRLKKSVLGLDEALIYCDEITFNISKFKLLA